MVKLNQRISELDERCEQLQDQYKDSRAEVAELRIANQNLVAEVGQDIKKAQDQRLKGHLSTLRGEIKKAQAEMKLEIKNERKSDMAALHSLTGETKKVQAETKQLFIKEIKSDIAALHSHVGLVPYVTMTGFERKKCSNHEWYSPPFYTHPHGYKMCLRVDASGNGLGKGSHVSVFVFIMKGEYDDSLKWPFRGDITLQLLNQVGDDDRHHVNTVHVTNDTNISKRVLEGEQSAQGRGYSTFIPHRDLTPHYLKDDCLMFCVKEVKIKSV